MNKYPTNFTRKNIRGDKIYIQFIKKLNNKASTLAARWSKSPTSYLLPFAGLKIQWSFCHFLIGSGCAPCLQLEHNLPLYFFFINAPPTSAFTVILIHKTIVEVMNK